MLKFTRFIGAIGMVIMAFGMACGDSESLMLPLLFILVGCALLSISALVERRYVEY